MTEYQTTDSGSRQEYGSGMRRDSQAGKPRFDLLLPAGVPYADQMLTRWAALMTRGGELYGDRNWEHARTADELERYKSSALRHMMQYLAGETDEDHAAAVLFNVMAAEYVRARVSAEPAGVDLLSDWEDPAAHGVVEDGVGGVWFKCSATCDLAVVRPGHAQCNCREEAA